MRVTAAEIIDRKHSEGSDAYLWAHTSGDVILWANEASSADDDGSCAVERWQVDAATVDALIGSGEVDDIG